jgi:RimJ/RimL family protein N-acetyltransferase
MSNIQPSVYDLMQIHVQALYVHDENSRLVSITDGGDARAPRFFLGRTEQGNVWRFRYDLPHKLCTDLKALCKTEPCTTADRPRHEAAYRRLLAAHSPVERIWFGPAYWFPHGAVVAPEPIRMNEQNAHLLQGDLQDWIPDVPFQQPFFALIVDGQAVAVCASVRITDAAHEVGVETAEGQRRKGYAVSVVSAWAKAVEERGARPLYSTSLENIASQNVAARLGLARYGVDFHIT